MRKLTIGCCSTVVEWMTGLFMNAQNWQTIPRIVGPLRRLGIPAAAIFDFDVLMDKDFQQVWPILNLDTAALTPLQQERSGIKKLLDAVGRQKSKTRGVSAFSGTDRTRIEDFLSTMRHFGVFFVSVGELECWLSALGIPQSNNKPAWLTAMFIKLGSDPSAANYVAPGTNDVWSFVDQAESWIANPDRQGIPV